MSSDLHGSRWRYIVLLLITVSAAAWAGEFPATLKVRVPRAVREGIVREASDYYAIIYPKADPKWIGKRLDSALGAEEWDILHNSQTGVVPEAELRLGTMRIYIPIVRNREILRFCFRDRDPHLPPKSLSAKVDKEAALRSARATVERIIRKRPKQPVLELTYQRALFGDFKHVWKASAGEMFDPVGCIDIDVAEKNGGVSSCKVVLYSYPKVDDQWLKTRKDVIARLQEVYQKGDPVDESAVRLSFWHHLGQSRIIWAHSIPPRPQAERESNWFDAASGDLIYSTDFDAQGKKVERYNNPKYYRYRSKAGIVKRLEELLNKQAVELEKGQK